MASKITKPLFIAGLLLIVCVAIFFSSEWNRAAFGSRGFEDNGSKFGIEIGSQYSEAEQHLLSKGLVPYDLEYNPKVSKAGIKKCHGHEYPDDVYLQAFDDDSWRRGIICVASKDNKVIRLSWHYGMFQP